MLKFLLLLALLTSCQRNSLSVFTEYVSLETLPSYRLGTPDPEQYCPEVGEKLHIKWSLPQSNSYCTLEMKISIRFGNQEDAYLFLDLNKPTGIYVYSLLNEEYWSKEGIFAYKIELFGDGEKIKDCTHLLWAEKISCQ